MFNEPFQEPTQSSFNYEIDVPGYSHKTFIFSVYTRLNQFERHFELISAKYKNMALTWLLAIYAAIGFLFSNETETLIFDHLAAVSSICFIGIIGITLIWHLDMNVYHRFWSALFIEEVLMEEKNPFLLRSKKISLLIDDSRERFLSQGFLYITANILLALTMSVSLMNIFKDNSFVLFYVMCFLLFIFVSVITFLFLYIGKRFQKNISVLLEQRRQESSEATKKH